MALDFIAKHELPPLLDAAGRDELTVIWIPVLASLYEETEIARYQAAHDPKKPLAGLNPAEQSQALVEIAKAIKTAFSSSPPITPSGDVQISTSRLPITGEHLVGREAELDWLDQSWNDSGAHIVVIVAWGGVGKSALVNGWLGELTTDDYRGAKRVFGWTFYSQGSGEARAASADPFIDAALRWFGDPDSSAGSPWEKGERLARYMRQQKILLILDGLEPLQYPPGPMEGRLKDPPMQALLRELAAANPGLCVITSRGAVTDLNPYSHSTVSVRKLEHLSEEAGTELLRELGVQGPEAELRQACREVQGHALTLNLLGNYLRKAWGGDVRARSEVHLLEADEKQGGHVGRVMQAYERWLGEGAELAILRLLGLFDRAAEGKALAALRAKPVIPGLTDALVGQRERDWQYAVTNLRDAGLLAAANRNDPDTLDAHPLVREHFGEQLRKQFPDAWREGHSRLYEYFKNEYLKTTLEFPNNLEEMLPLYAAVMHGCQAGQAEEAFKEVYWKHIVREKDIEEFNERPIGVSETFPACLSAFFKEPWIQPLECLTDTQQIMVLDEAGFYLFLLNRLSDALASRISLLKERKDRQEWAKAAMNARLIREICLLQGNLKDAMDYAEESIKQADESAEPKIKMKAKCGLAQVLHYMGKLNEAQQWFLEAEDMQKEIEPSYPYLHSYEGNWYCDLLLDLDKVLDVQERANKKLQDFLTQ